LQRAKRLEQALLALLMALIPSQDLIDCSNKLWMFCYGMMQVLLVLPVLLVT
jgi:hypothetical protein